jgi:hypothetical protein
VADLEAAYRFRMNCESSDAILKTYVVNVVKQEEDTPSYDDVNFDDNLFGDEDHDHSDIIVKKEKPVKPIGKKPKGGNEKCLQICELCGREVRSLSQMRVHMRRHTGIGSVVPAQCFLCLNVLFF